MRLEVCFIRPLFNKISPSLTKSRVNVVVRNVFTLKPKIRINANKQGIQPSEKLIVSLWKE